jgi:hypothetical protein
MKEVSISLSVCVFSRDRYISVISYEVPQILHGYWGSYTFLEHRYLSASIAASGMVFRPSVVLPGSALRTLILPCLFVVTVPVTVRLFC